MAKEFVGRELEMKEMRGYMESGNSEFIAVYGRRRVGKTYLIRKAADEKFDFFMTGAYNASKSDQLTNFAVAFQRYTQSDQLVIPKNWILAFHMLAQYLEKLPQRNKVLFFDELPWMDTAKSGFFSALENFWNSWASLRKDIKLIVCGSATSWMINKLIRNRGGLHNRLTHRIELQPFTLRECEEYFKNFKFPYTCKQIAECYMVMGGTPYYLSMMDHTLSLAQNIDQLFFAKNASLKDEFGDLYRALFKNSLPHIQVVTTLATKGIGLNRQDLLSATGLADNGAFSTVLEELEQCGFVRVYEPFQSEGAGVRQKRQALYQLVDFYTLFYFKFIKANKYSDDQFWTSSLNTPLHNTWAGLSFELLCMHHLPQLKQALGIAGISTRTCSWRGKTEEGAAQIDLLIDRKDDTINLCEMKYCKTEYNIDKAYEAQLTEKVEVFRSGTGTRKAVVTTLVTTYGLKQNAHSDVVQRVLVLEDMFMS